MCFVGGSGGKEGSERSTRAALERTMVLQEGGGIEGRVGRAEVQGVLACVLVGLGLEGVGE